MEESEVRSLLAHPWAPEAPHFDSTAPRSTRSSRAWRTHPFRAQRAAFHCYEALGNQKYRWLALIFGGLHTLDEMGRDYRSAFWGQAEHIRVGYLARDDALRLITQPSPDFALEYAPELREEIYRLTYGQPYLLQRLCWELVTRWNERFLQAGENTPRTLTLDDLEPVLTADFYASANYYFDGVRSNVTEEERRLMTIMAKREGTWTLSELAAAAEGMNLQQVLGLLRRHDVMVEDSGEIRFASELMRRSVVLREQADSSYVTKAESV